MIRSTYHHGKTRLTQSLFLVLVLFLSVYRFYKQGNTIEIPEVLQYSRELYVTYLDEDLLVVRDGSGVPELLVRPSKVSPM